RARARDRVARPGGASVGGGQLAAGPVDIGPAGVADGGGDAVVDEPADEFVGDLRFGGRPHRARGRVERDRVDVHPAAAAGVELLRQQLGPPGVIVHVLDQRVFDAHAPTGDLEVVVGGVDGLIGLPPGVDRDHLIAQLVVGGV